MRFSTSAALVAIASTVAANDFSKAADADASVWEKLETTPAVFTTPKRTNNRPAKRQSGWNPPSNLAAPLKEVWDHCKATYSNGNLFGFKNYGWDQLIANKGAVNVCVRWESSATVTEAQRKQVAEVYAKQYKKWFQWLYGFDGFPYSDVKVNVVGWAVNSASQLQGSTSGIDVHTGFTGEGAPQCDPACGRFFHQDGNYGGCKGGAERHYDQSLWLTDGFGGGAGGDWGQRIGREYFMGALNQENVHILLHEMGHTYGLDDFYDWTPSGVPGFIMQAGAASQITDFDGWMLRNWWYELSRNRSGWKTASATTPVEAVAEEDESAAAPSGGVPTANPVPTGGVAAPVDEDDSCPPDEDDDETPAPQPTTPAPQPTQAPNPGTGTVPKWGQCGGIGYSGATECVSGATCTKQNDYYSQCL